MLGWRSWSWRDLIALSYLRVGQGCEQGGECSSLGGRQRPAGVATNQADQPADGERAAGGLRLGAWRRLDGAVMLGLQGVPGSASAAPRHRLAAVGRAAKAISGRRGASSPTGSQMASAGLP
ncbi:MAG: hypothetical protein ACRDZ6_11335, partial [Acidimicrobiales bacterium]